MPQEITELVDDPTVIESDYDVSLSRWQKYGHDRLYVNGFETGPYVDLKEDKLGDTGHVALKIERDGDTITLWRKGKRDEREIVISLSGDIQEDEGDQEENDDEMVHAEVPDAVPYNSRTAGIAQQINAQRLFSDGGEADVEVSKEEQPSQEADDSDSDGESEHMFASDDSECRHVDCSETPDMAAECDTGQTKYYCEEHGGSRRAGHALVEEWREL
jgi:hypothetical protein